MGRFAAIGKARVKGRPATEKQLEFIEQLHGEEWPYALTMQEASEVIEVLLDQNREGEDYWERDF